MQKNFLVRISSRTETETSSLETFLMKGKTIFLSWTTASPRGKSKEEH